MHIYKKGETGGGGCEGTEIIILGELGMLYQR